MNIVCNCGTLLADKQIQMDFIRKMIEIKKEQGVPDSELLAEQAKYVNAACDTIHKICCKTILLTYVNLIPLIK